MRGHPVCFAAPAMEPSTTWFYRGEETPVLPAIVPRPILAMPYDRTTSQAQVFDEARSFSPLQPTPC